MLSLRKFTCLDWMCWKNIADTRGLSFTIQAISCHRAWDQPSAVWHSQLIFFEHEVLGCLCFNPSQMRTSYEGERLSHVLKLIRLGVTGNIVTATIKRSKLPPWRINLKVEPSFWKHFLEACKECWTKFLNMFLLNLPCSCWPVKHICLCHCRLLRQKKGLFSEDYIE